MARAGQAHVPFFPTLLAPRRERVPVLPKQELYFVLLRLPDRCELIKPSVRLLLPSVVAAVPPLCLATFLGGDDSRLLASALNLAHPPARAFACPCVSRTATMAAATWAQAA
mmetsp:Transcript_32965/g.106600  ORF Transcript_32965/g.106600 Transcript_32965/m.106600 type:complete len:112 (-) Transcript_32965:1204-1539(-)